MRIDLPLCDFQNCRKRFDGNCIDSHYETCEYKQMKDKEYKYRWHDLLADKSDLPKYGEVVLCELTHKIFMHGKYVTCKFYNADKWSDKPYFDYDHNGFPKVKRWRYIDD